MSFLQDYEIVTSNNECPKMFHHFSALVALSSIVSSRVWLDQGQFVIRPNLYVILTASAGVKKTTAMSVAKRLLRELGEKVPLSAEAQTKEALVQSMANKSRECKVEAGQVPKNFSPLDEERSKFLYTPMAVFVTELSQFVGSGSGHMVDFLTTIYDEEQYTNETKNKGTDKLPCPYLTMLACTVPDWITSNMKSDIISSGFCRRAIFVYETASDLRVPFPEVTEPMVEAWERLIAYSQQLLEVKGPMLWGEGAKDFYSDWYMKLTRPTDPIMEGWFNSVHVQVLKIAMLISLSEGLTRVIQVVHIEMALELIKMIETNIPRVFNGVGRNELSSIAHKLIEMLGSSDGKRMPEKLIKRTLFKEADPVEIAKILQHLKETGQVVREVHKHKDSGKEIPFIRLTQ